MVVEFVDYDFPLVQVKMKEVTIEARMPEPWLEQDYQRARVVTGLQCKESQSAIPWR